jgi:hypothetical protein
LPRMFDTPRFNSHSVEQAKASAILFGAIAESW